MTNNKIVVANDPKMRELIDLIYKSVEGKSFDLDTITPMVLVSLSDLDSSKSGFMSHLHQKFMSEFELIGAYAASQDDWLYNRVSVYKSIKQNSQIKTRDQIAEIWVGVGMLAVLKYLA